MVEKDVQVIQKTLGNGKRYYCVIKDGKEHKLTSVTTILGELDKPALIPWALKSAVTYVNRQIEGKEEIACDKLKMILEASKKEYKFLKDEAAEIGTEVHNSIEDYLKTGKKPSGFKTKSAENGFNSFIKWANKNKFEMIESETPIYNIEEEYAGTTDCVCFLNKKRYLIDFKTSKGIYFPSMGMQLSSYVYALNKMNPPEEKIKGMGILRLDKVTGLPEWADMTKDAKAYLDMFLALNNFHKAKMKLDNGGFR
jgi:hypothetical protein